MKARFSLKKFIVALIVLLTVVYFITRLTEMQTIAETLRQGDWRFIALAIGVQIIWLLNVSGSVYMIHRALGLNVKFWRIAILTGSATFVNVVTPSGGMGGIGVFVAEARLRKYSSVRVMVASGVFALFEYVGFGCVLLFGLAILFERNHLNAPEMIASALLLAFSAFLARLLYLGMYSPEKLARFLARLAQRGNAILRPFLHREYFSEKRAHLFAFEAGSGLQLLRQKPRNLIIPAALALSSKLLLMLVLFLIFQAFNEKVTISTLVAGFSVGNLFNIVSPTPSGIGVVEGALTLVFTSLGVPLGASTVIALAYRGIVFWLPLFIGMLTFRWALHRGESRGSEEAPANAAVPERLPD